MTESDWAKITEATHVRVFVEAGNGSHVCYYPKTQPLESLEYALPWVAPRQPGWTNAA